MNSPLAGEIIRVKESIPWVRCASGNVFVICGIFVTKVKIRCFLSHKCWNKRLEPKFLEFSWLQWMCRFMDAYLGAEWRTMHILQTYFWGAKLPVEAAILNVSEFQTFTFRLSDSHFQTFTLSLSHLHFQTFPSMLQFWMLSKRTNYDSCMFYVFMSYNQVQDDMNDLKRKEQCSRHCSESCSGRVIKSMALVYCNKVPQKYLVLCNKTVFYCRKTNLTERRR